jgi:hypothetical protein
MHVNSNTRTVNLDPRYPTFVQDTYAAYDVIRTTGPAFKWGMAERPAILSTKTPTNAVKQ